MSAIASGTQVSKEFDQQKSLERSRAEALADRIEEGAALLAAFAESLTEAEWQTPVSATDRRPVGVIVHHVASVYPVEIDLARAIASGKAVTSIAGRRFRPPAINIAV